MLLRKQTAYNQTFSVTLEFSPSRIGYEAGLVLWWNQYSYATIGITLVELPSGEKVQTVVTRMPKTEGAESSSVSWNPPPSSPDGGSHGRVQETPRSHH